MIDSERYLMACYRYIELNPARAGMTALPGEYPWSSYAHNAWGQPHPLLTPHQEYLNLGTDPAARQAAYRELVREHLDEPQVTALRQHTQQQRAWGSDRFRQQIEVLTRQAAGIRPRGRPRKAAKALRK
jgi:putative transposase